ncbi:DUF2259 domain-containing protein [bacterium]|nr:DUF2259 domain-containing protein [bacterium]
MIRYIWFLFLFNFISKQVNAGDESSCAVLGFSLDGRYVAFEMFGVHDGTGFPYSSVFIVDVPANKYLVESYEVGQEEENQHCENVELQIRKLAIEKTSEKFAKYQISFGNVGRSQKPENILPQFFHFVDGQISYQIEVIETELYGNNITQNCNDGFPVKRFNLELTIGNSIWILEKDIIKDCPFFHSIENVVIYKNSIVIFIRYSKPGFEGPDYRQIALTCMIKT